MVFTDHDLDVVSRTVWGEARGEVFAGKIAVGWIILNRLTDSKKRYGASLADVCQKPYQFSCWNDGDPNKQKLLSIGIEDAAFKDCLCAVAWTFSNNAPDPTNGSRFYKVVGTYASWAIGKTSTRVIGHHEFFNDIE